MAGLYRIVQWTMCRVTGMISHEPEVIKGAGSLMKLPEMLAGSREKSSGDGPLRVLVATTPGFIRRGSLEEFFKAMESAGIRVRIFSNVVPDPTVECVEEMAKEYVLGSCSAIVAIGGGSVMDCSKAAAARIACPDKQIRDMKGILKIRRKLPDLYAVPTTAGTGSEATAAAVVTDTVDGRHYKYPISDPCLIPKCAVLDPALAVDLPPHITAATGMDALTHAVEAYTNRFPSAMVREKALDAVERIYENLPAAFEAKRGAAGEISLEARENMLVASYEAGVAFTNNFVGYVHAVAHGIGALYGVAHGQANAIILPYVMEQFGRPAEPALAELAAAAGVASLEERDGAADHEAAAAFIQSIREMNEAFGIPDKIEELKEEDYEILIDRAMGEANYTYPVPVTWWREDFRKLLEKLKA